MLRFSAQSISLEKTQILKGFAIIAVVLIHIFSNWKGIYTTSDYQLFYVGLDQLLRFCVPLFILLSGYGLGIKYTTSKLELIPYVQRRILKIIPLYILWSLFSYFLFRWLPGWDYSSVQESFLSKLLYGRADYHLYFLPLIIQLYALFPILLWFSKRYSKLTMFIALCVQVGFYSYYAMALVDPTVPKWALTDSLQYLFAGSWIGYFTFGIYLAVNGLPKKVQQLWPLFSLIGFGWVTYAAYTTINVEKIDPLIALKFTKIAVIGYTIPTMVTMTLVQLQTSSKNNVVSTFKTGLQFLGEHSYLIFLSHTVLLRMYYSLIGHQLPLSTLALSFLAWLIVVVISKKIS